MVVVVSVCATVVGATVACAPAPNEPPTPSLPASVSIAEGTSARIAAPEVVSATGTGVDVRVDGEEVVITAAIGATAGTVTVTLADGDGDGDGDETHRIDVDVRPLAMTHVLWSDATGPAAREHGAMMVDDASTTLFVFGGGGYPNFPSQEILEDAWRYDLAAGTWSTWAISGDLPPAAASRRVASLGENQALLFGGYDSDFNTDNLLTHVDLTTGRMTSVTSTGPTPPPRTLHVFAWDEVRQQLLVFGGFSQTPASQAILNDTWRGTFDVDAMTVTWEELVLPVAPPARYGAFAGLDAAEGRLVVYSGAGAPSQVDPVGAITDVWALVLDEDTPEWRNLFTDGPMPNGRRNGCGVFDPSTHGLVVFGGTADARTGEPGLFVLDVRDDGTWHDLSDRQGPVLLRSSGFGVALPGGGVTCGFGNDAEIFQDLFFFRSGTDAEETEAP